MFKISGHTVEITNVMNCDMFDDSLIDDIKEKIDLGETEGYIYDFNSNQFFWEII